MAYDAQTEALHATIAAIRADPHAELPDGAGDDLVRVAIIGEPAYEPHPLVVATLPLMIGGLMVGGASMLRKARAEARIAREPR